MQFKKRLGVMFLSKSPICLNSYFHSGTIRDPESIDQLLKKQRFSRCFLELYYKTFRVFFFPAIVLLVGLGGVTVGLYEMKFFHHKFFSFTKTDTKFT